MKESPLYRRRQARGISIEDAAYISRAGRDVVTETIGREVGGLGTVIAEALGKAKKQSKDKKDEQDNASQVIQSATDLGKGFTESTQGISSGVEDTLKDFANKINTESTTDVGGALEAPKSESPQKYATFTDKMAWDNMSEANKAILKKEQGIVDYDTFHRSAKAWRDQNDPKGEMINLTADGMVRDASVSTPWGGVKSPNNRLSPLERRGRSRAFSNELAGLYSVGEPGPVEGSSDTSQYTPGRTYVEKERLLSAPSWMGSAAIQGYNMVVKARNYEKQVQADSIDYYNEKLKGLDPGRSGYNILDDSVNELVMQQQQEYINHAKQRNQWFKEGRGAEWENKSKQYTTLADNILNGRDALKGNLDQVVEGLENNTIDLKMSDPRSMDFYNTLLKGGGVIGLTDLGDGPTLAGGTRRNEPVDMNLANIQQILSGITLVQKQEPMEFYNEFMGNLKSGKIPGVEKEIIEDANGIKTSKYNMDQIDSVIDLYIKEELQSIADAKGYGGALLDMTHSQWEASSEAGEDPRKAIAEKMKSDLKNLLGPLAGFESREGTARSTQLQKARLDQQKREIKTSVKQRKEDNLNSLIDSIMQEGEKSYGPDKIVKGDTAIPELKMKTTGTDYPGASIIEGAKGVKTTNFNPDTGILTIQPSAAITVKDGNTTVKTKEPQTIDFTQDPAVVRQNLKNLLEQLKITGPSDNARGEQSVTATTKESNFRTKYNY